MRVDEGSEALFSDLSGGLVQPFYLTGGDAIIKPRWYAGGLPD